MLPKHIFLTVALTVAGIVHGAYVGYLYPAGGRAGEEVEILVGGQGIGGTNSVIVTGDGVRTISSESVRGVPHPSGSQRRYLNRWVKKIISGDKSFLRLPAGENGTVDWRYHPWYSRLNETTPLQFELVTHFLFVPRNPLQMSPSISQNVILKLKIDKNAKPGLRELRLTNGAWVSNPVPFYISDVAEVKEPRFQPPYVKVETPVFSYPCVLNGQIMPGETDKFFFEAKKGEVLYFDLKARSLLPFVGDGVPGYFQAVIEIQNEDGKQLAFADDRYFHPDPVLKFVVPFDGKYQLLVRDALYRGRNDFVYRIEVDKNPRPYVIDAPPEFAVQAIKVEKGAEKTVFSAPVVIFDRIEKPGVPDCWYFKASAGEKLVVDVWARRLNSPLDGFIEVYDPSGKRIAFCDDVKRQRVGLVMQHTDPWLCFTAQTSGVYKVVVKDNAGSGGEDYKYYLRIDQPRPDFRAYGSPSMLEPASGGRCDFYVVVERLDGFDGPVKIHLESPDGYRLCGETTVPAGVSQATFTLDSVMVRKGKMHNVKLYATANGITRKVVPATEAMQAFAYNHLIPCQGDFYASKNGRYWASCYINWQEKNPAPIKLYPGSSAVVSVSTVKWIPTGFTVTGMSLKDQPQGVLIEDVKYKDGVATAVIKVTADAKPVVVNQVIYVNIAYNYKYRERGSKKVVYRKAAVVGLLPARRLIVEVPKK